LLQRVRSHRASDHDLDVWTPQNPTCRTGTSWTQRRPPCRVRHACVTQSRL